MHSKATVLCAGIEGPARTGDQQVLYLRMSAPAWPQLLLDQMRFIIRASGQSKSATHVLQRENTAIAGSHCRAMAYVKPKQR